MSKHQTPLENKSHQERLFCAEDSTATHRLQHHGTSEQNQPETAIKTPAELYVLRMKGCPDDSDDVMDDVMTTVSAPCYRVYGTPDSLLMSHFI